jgi:hypothetical protein
MDTVTMQELPAGIEPPVRLTVEAPPTAVSVPPQVLPALPETTMPLGNVSVSGAVKLAGVAPALLKVMVRTDTPPALIVAGLKALPSVTGEGVETVKVATAAAVLFPLLVTKSPAASVLM